MEKFRKVSLFLALLVSISAATKYIYEMNTESVRLAFHDYLYKADHVEKKYKGYYGYRYYLWLKEVIPPGASFGLLIPEGADKKLFNRYQTRLRYFLYPERIAVERPDFLFTPKLSKLKMLSENNKIVLIDGSYYNLIATKDDTGIFKRK
jgi:hypothetical protein